MHLLICVLDQTAPGSDINTLVIPNNPFIIHVEKRGNDWVIFTYVDDIECFRDVVAANLDKTIHAQLGCPWGVTHEPLVLQKIEDCISALCFPDPTLRQELQEVLESCHETLFAIPGVLCVGAGYKTVRGFTYYSRPCIKVYVHRKMKETSTPIPPTLGKFATDVVASKIDDRMMTSPSHDGDDNDGIFSSSKHFFFPCA